MVIDDNDDDDNSGIRSIRVLFRFFMDHCDQSRLNAWERWVFAYGSQEYL